MSATGDAAAAVASPVDIVAIGTSAGGVSALGIVLGALPADFRAVVVVAQHRDPHHESLMPTLLRRRCRLPVADAVDGERLERTHVYLAPRNVHLVLRGWEVALTEENPVHFSRPSVDVLFRSVAEAFGARALGVILTGAGRDGADGVTAIKRRGGVVVVEDPAIAEYGGMPAAAQATGCVDLTLPLAMIGPAIVRLVVAAGRVAHG